MDFNKNENNGAASVVAGSMNGADLTRLGTKVKWFKLVISVYGLAWLANAAFEVRAWLIGPPKVTADNLLNRFAGSTHHVSGWLQSPDWLNSFELGVKHGVAAVGPHGVAVVMVVIATLMGLALLTRRALRAVCIFGVVYTLIYWLLLSGLGFPYSGGQTDPGTVPLYTITFLFILGVLPTLDDNADAKSFPSPAWNFAVLVFGLLWIFIGILKFLPGFMFHFVDQITGPMAGNPHWIVAWLTFIENVTKAVGPVFVAVCVGIIELAVGVSILSRRGMKIIIPLAIAYGLFIWCSVETFGGPYGPQGTGCNGNVIGNVIIYMFPLSMLLIDLYAGRSAGREATTQHTTAAS